MEAKLIDLNEWERFGGGGNGWAYNNKADSSLMLKLNKESISKEKAYNEFLKSKYVHDMGIECPEVHEFVTDGSRFGYTVQRITGKKSYARIISEDPSQLEPLAKEFAQRSKKFHSVECDTKVLQEHGEKLWNAINGCQYIPQDAKDIIKKCIDSFDKANTPVHGDFTPGNIIRTKDRDYWIDLGDFSYGDPDFDLESMLFLARYTPDKVVKYLFHISSKQFEEFMQIYGREYYGDRWNTPEMEAKLEKIAIIKAGMAMTNSQTAGKLYLPVVYGQKLKFKIIKALANITIRKYN